MSNFWSLCMGKEKERAAHQEECLVADRDLRPPHGSTGEVSPQPGTVSNAIVTYSGLGE